MGLFCHMLLLCAVVYLCEGRCPPSQVFFAFPFFFFVVVLHVNLHTALFVT